MRDSEDINRGSRRGAGRPKTRTFYPPLEEINLIEAAWKRLSKEKKEATLEKLDRGQNGVTSLISDARLLKPCDPKFYSKVCMELKIDFKDPDDKSSGSSGFIGQEAFDEATLPFSTNQSEEHEEDFDAPLREDKTIWREFAANVREDIRRSSAVYSMFTGRTDVDEAAVSLVATRSEHPVRPAFGLPFNLLPSQRDVHTRSEDGMTLSEAVKEAKLRVGHPWVMVAGEPGLGKTTLLQRMVALTEGTEIIPLFIRAKEWERFSADEWSMLGDKGTPVGILNMKSWLTSWLSYAYAHTAWQRELQRVGKVIGTEQFLLLVDGLDEAENQRGIENEIYEFAKSTRSTVIVTCRTSHAKGMLPQFHQTALQPLSESEIRGHLERRGERERAFWTLARREQFFSQTTQGGRVERLSPLLGNGLALAMTLHLCEEGLLQDENGHIRLVDSLAALYDVWSLQLAFSPVTRFRQMDRYAPVPDEWLADSKFPPSSAQDSRVQAQFVDEEQQFLEEIAFQTFACQKRNNFNIRCDEVLDYRDGRSERRKAVMLSDIIETTGLLVATTATTLGGSDATFEFAHQTVQEYFAARYLAKLFHSGRTGVDGHDWSGWIPPLDDVDTFCAMVNEANPVSSPFDSNALAPFKTLLIERDYREMMLTCARGMGPQRQQALVNSIWEGLVSYKFREFDKTDNTIVRTRNALQHLALSIAARSPHDYSSVLKDLLPSYAWMADGSPDEFYSDVADHSNLDELVNPRNWVNKAAANRHYLSVLRSETPPASGAPYNHAKAAGLALSTIGEGYPQIIESLVEINRDMSFDEETQHAAYFAASTIVYKSIMSPEYAEAMVRAILTEAVLFDGSGKPDTFGVFLFEMCKQMNIGLVAQIYKSLQ